MKLLKNTLLLLLLCASVAHADIYFFNATDENLTIEATLPNGDTKSKSLKADSGYGPTQASISNSKPDKTAFKVLNEDGEVIGQDVGAYARTFLIYSVGGQLKMHKASWYLSNGQVHKRKITFFNVIDRPVTFDIIDSKEVRKGLTLAPGESMTVPAKNGFSGSSGFHDIRFADGNRKDKSASAGYFVIFHYDKREPGVIQVENSGHITPPKGITD